MLSVKFLIYLQDLIKRERTHRVSIYFAHFMYLSSKQQPQSYACNGATRCKRLKLSIARHLSLEHHYTRQPL